MSYLRAGRPGLGSQYRGEALSDGCGTPWASWSRRCTLDSCTSLRPRVSPYGECACGCSPHSWIWGRRRWKGACVLFGMTFVHFEWGQMQQKHNNVFRKYSTRQRAKKKKFCKYNQKMYFHFAFFCFWKKFFNDVTQSCIFPFSRLFGFSAQKCLERKPSVTLLRICKTLRIRAKASAMHYVSPAVVWNP